MSSTDNITEVPLNASVPNEPPSDTTSPQTHATEPPVAPQSVPGTMLDTFCTAIRDFEGAPGQLNYRNNNPGNVRCSPVGYASRYGNVQCVNNFAVFPTYELGWDYLEALVSQRANLHPDWMIADFFEQYAPSGDNNNPTAYALFVAKRCGVSINTTLKELFG